MTHPGWGEEWRAAGTPGVVAPTTDAARAQGTRPPDPNRHATHPHRRHRHRHHWFRRRTRRRLWLGASTLGVLVVGAGFWLAADAARAQSALDAARADVATLEKQARAGDADAAQHTLTSLQTNTATAHGSTQGPVWSLARAVPWVGSNVRAVQTVTAAVDDLALHALPGLVDASTVVAPQTLAPSRGTIPLGPLESVAPRVVASDEAVRAALGQLDDVDTSGLADAVARPLAQLRTQVAGIAVTTGTAARAARLLPPMLGADGPRTYLLLVQNNAEQRATGGIPGSVLLLRADKGKVSVVEQRSGASLAGLTKPVSPLTDAEKALFGTSLGTDMRDVTFTPDFPRSAALAAAVWHEKVGGTVDGVLSTDPVALGQLLQATGPVTLDDGSRLTSKDAAQTLLNGVYLDIPKPADQDAYFALAARSVFDAAVDGAAKPAATVDSLAQAARDGRLLVWSTHPEEQDQLAGTVLSGALDGSAPGPGGAPGSSEASGARATSPVVGVYLEDGTQAKLGYYLDLAVGGKATACRADGSQLVSLDVTLSSRAPAAAADLPAYLVGPDKRVAAGSTRTNVLVYAPTGGGITTSHLDPGPQGLFAQVHDGLVVGARTFTVAPGQKATMKVTIMTGKGQSGPIRVRSTPTVRQSGAHEIPSACTSQRVASQ